MKGPFDDYGRYYDLLYREKDYAAESRYVAKTLRELDSNVQRVLEFGSGTGRHGRLLAEDGFEVIGIERSSTMVAAAAAPAVPGPGSFRSLCGDVRSTSAGGTFDAVVSLFHVVCYQTTDEDLEATFANASRHLRAGGLFLFDVWHGPAVLAEPPAIRVKRAADGACRLVRISEPVLDRVTATVTVRYTLFVATGDAGTYEMLEEEHRVRYLFPREIEMLARRCGYSVVRTEEFLTGEPVSDRTFGVAYVLRQS